MFESFLIKNPVYDFHFDYTFAICVEGPVHTMLEKYEYAKITNHFGCDRAKPEQGKYMFIFFKKICFQIIFLLR